MRWSCRRSFRIAFVQLLTCALFDTPSRYSAGYESNLTLQLEQHRGSLSSRSYPSSSYSSGHQHHQQQYTSGHLPPLDPYTQFVQSPVEQSHFLEPQSIPRSYHLESMQSPHLGGGGQEHHSAPHTIFSGSYDGSGDSYLRAHPQGYSNGGSSEQHSLSESPNASPVPPNQLHLASQQHHESSISTPMMNGTPAMPHPLPEPLPIHGTMEGLPSPTMTDGESASPRRVFIAPGGQYYASSMPPPPTPQSATMTAAASSSTSAAFSTHDPPTPGPESAPAHMTGFRMFSPLEQSNIAYANGHPGLHPGAHAGMPQTAPLPFIRRASADDTASLSHIPQTPMSAYGHHPSMLAYHQAYSHYPYGPAGMGKYAPPPPHSHHVYYPGMGGPGEDGEYSLPPPSATSSMFSSSFPLSPYEARQGFYPSHMGPGGGGGVHYLSGAQNIGIGHPAPLPPLRMRASHESIQDDAHPTSPKLSAAAAARLLEPTPMSSTINLEEEVKTIEAASGATAFVSKLWFLLSQPQEFGEYIRWTVKGTGFILSHSELILA